MALERYLKSPAERKLYDLDYSDWLGAGETITDVVFAVTPSAVTGLTIDAWNIGAPATSVAYFAALGDLNVQYKVDIQVTTSAGQVKEDTVLFDIRAA